MTTDTGYTPLKHEIKAAAISGRTLVVYKREQTISHYRAEEVAAEEFERWMESERRKWQVEALREAAEMFEPEVIRVVEPAPLPRRVVIARLRDRVAELENGEER